MIQMAPSYSTGVSQSKTMLCLVFTDKAEHRYQAILEPYQEHLQVRIPRMGGAEFEQSCSYRRRENGESPPSFHSIEAVQETDTDDQHAGEFVEQVRWFMNLIINVDESREI
jgi:hypothetical protein